MSESDTMDKGLSLLLERADKWADTAAKAAATREQLNGVVASFLEVLDTMEYRAAEEARLLRAQVEAMSMRAEVVANEG